MKTIILAAAVTAFELAFVASIASTPSPAPETVSVVRSGEAGPQALAQRSGAPVPCTPRG
jgi:hypothetical protein